MYSNTAIQLLVIENLFQNILRLIEYEGNTLSALPNTHSQVPMTLAVT